MVTPRILSALVRNAPQYQHMPKNFTFGRVWQWLSGLIFWVKQIFLYGRVSRRRLHSLRRLRNSRVGKSVLIIGNGPSAKSLTIEKVQRFRQQGGDVIVMNSFDRNPLSKSVIPDYYFFQNPAHEIQNNSEKKTILNYLEKHREITLVQSSLANMHYSILNPVIHINGIQAVGLWTSDSPLKANTYPQGVLFSALKFASFMGYSPIYVTGVDNSFYLHHFHNQLGRVIIKTNGLHSYAEELTGEFQETNSYLTRNMSDVLYAHAIFLRDLRKFGDGKAIVNIGLSDHTNDAFPFGCLLP